MSARISHSLLDPYVGPKLQSLYPRLPIPTGFPPEGIVLIGHLSAIVGAIGLAYSTTYWWAGVLAAIGIVGNHLADCVDGTHARSTGQCRNGGELLDHFTDPLSFAYYLIGIGVACARLDLALVAVVCLFAIAVLTNIKAKLIGEFTLAKFGPTEFKAVLCLLGLTIAGSHASWNQLATPTGILTIAYVGLIVIGLVQLPIQLVRSVREVNRKGGAPDTSQWQLID
ncbi:CDP-alcohol phosphatidyltransferase family protein [Stieleria sp. TO1_6]|uniref:CDP-alcohol phosphatidyltransferase family protein n=1 Tax=Stieleria tagensis TaxID=2956795 RepID=UPI00209A9C3A|nr:CDP-alcohol phosphatidyltransferase family protein [Stieleria tagensis]MCO8120717.1 CDP-alcohol phosphatidyltransferase family protein [Stieleria tagensis]